MSGERMRTGGQILADQLRLHGVDLVFGVPGESYLALLDGLIAHEDAIRFIACRHEGGAANMAEAHGKLTGRPGICMVTRGPGASHAAVGLHTARQDSTPLILFVGQVERAVRGREAFQEVDYRRMFGDAAKWIAEIDDAARIPEFVQRAFATATAGRPGPVVLALPEDMLVDAVDVADSPPVPAAQGYPSPDAMAELRRLLESARRPLAIVGGGTWNAQAREDFEAFARAWNLPVVASYRCQDYVDNRHPNYAGHASFGLSATLAAAIREADLLIAAGPRLGEITTSGYTLVTPPLPGPALVHVHPDPEELHSVYRASLGVVAGLPQFARAAAGLAPTATPPWADWSSRLRRAYLDGLEDGRSTGAVDMRAIVAHLRSVLPDDAIVANGAGNYAIWIHRYFPFHGWRTQLAPTSGAMGYGVPAGVAAALAHPDRTVVSVSGDGCFLMCGQELATALQYGARTIFLVINNGLYGTIRMHQERHYPGRTIGTDLVNPDFAAYARAFGAHGEVVTETAQFADAFTRARAAGRAALIEIRIDPENIAPNQTLSGVRAASRQN